MNTRHRALFVGTALAAGAMTLLSAEPREAAEAAVTTANRPTLVHMGRATGEPAVQRQEAAGATPRPTAPSAAVAPDEDKLQPRRPG